MYLRSKGHFVKRGPEKQPLPFDRVPMIQVKWKDQEIQNFTQLLNFIERKLLLFFSEINQPL